MKKEIMYLFLMIGVLFIYGCSSGTDVQVELEKTNFDTGEVQKTTQTVEQLVDSKSPYLRFNKAHYEQSLQNGKVVFLDFHADWCPICLREGPEIKAAFNELNNEDVVGYQVHYNDGRTTDDDRDMAKKYGITLQHTKVIIDKNGEVALKSLESFSKERTLNEINKVAG
jgi:thiol-disulfide isomerase/thioredoxin